MATVVVVVVVVVVLTRSHTVWVSVQPFVRIQLIPGATSLWTQLPRPCTCGQGSLNYTDSRHEARIALITAMRESTSAT